MCVLEEEAQRFLRTLGRHKDHELGELTALLEKSEIENIESYINKYMYSKLLRFARLGFDHGVKKIPPLAQLQLLVGLGDGTVSEQVQTAIFDEMNNRGWVWESRQNVNHTPLVNATKVSNAQISRFLHDCEDANLKTSTLDRITQVVELKVRYWGWTGKIHGALAIGKSDRRRAIVRDDGAADSQAGEAGDDECQGGTVTQQIRRVLGQVMGMRGWTQKDVACWSGLSQSQVSRFCQGGEIKTAALDRLGALFWLEIILKRDMN